MLLFSYDLEKNNITEKKIGCACTFSLLYGNKNKLVNCFLKVITLSCRETNYHVNYYFGSRRQMNMIIMFYVSDVYNVLLIFYTWQYYYFFMLTIVFIS